MIRLPFLGRFQQPPSQWKSPRADAWEHFVRIGLIIALCGVVGCGGKQDTTPGAAAPSPISVDQWRALPVREKYEEATFERLKMHDPQLKDERKWQRFMVETVIPERRTDLPDDFAP